MGEIFWLSMRQLGGRMRLALVLFLAALPVALAVIVFFTAREDIEYELEQRFIEFTNG